MTKFQDLKSHSKPELYALLSDYRKKLAHLRFDLAAGKIKNIREIRKVKKDIARILTLLNQ